ncbi:Dolichol kinase [Taphrina deformans PYCC 5710]|uniref:dolichol kinase n=1 Tax=Taphrina deformans (strain PYCC 5710 / ATCC 11124 / CBS 356.35 / IMI 108563 / JCM 9778 / NBRC 8474) TaxID=1097556 RepID=R4XCD2_TAPDE|nr:Dolichol kinase [Taphrina deformans PYCC 5710]|eukprot:CCG83481.1 Dolichol kinase [Taphrina deformans PYCC 5710]
MALPVVFRNVVRVSSNATRIYQILEWLLILAINLRHADVVDGLGTRKIAFFETLRSLIAGEALVWQLLLGVTILVTVTTYEARSQWMSLLLYVVLLPQSVALTKCSASTGSLLATNVQITVVSYLHAFLPYFRPLGHWTPQPDTSIQFLGYLVSDDIYVATLHLQVLRLGRELVGRSLNTIELDLLAHALTSFTIHYLRAAPSDLNHLTETFLFTFIYGLLIAIFPTIPILKRNVQLAKIRPHHRPKNTTALHNRYAIRVYGIVTVMILALVRHVFIRQTGLEPFIFVVGYLIERPMRIALAIYWAVVSTTGVIVVIYFWGSKPVGGISGLPDSARRLLRQSTENSLHHAADDDVFFEEEDTIARRARALDRRRKFFHGLIVVLFLPTMNIEPELTYLALSLAFTAFIFEEVIRVTVLPPFGPIIHKFLSGFTDDRDTVGHLVVSHLFLLLGVAGPVWLTLTARQHPSVTSGGSQNIAMLAGVLTLGAGDAAASIVGKKFGRHKWPGLKKSGEGTAAFIAAMMCGGYVAQLLNARGEDMPWQSFCAAVVLTGLLEAVSTQNDNLIIPVYMWSMVYR